MKKKVMYKIVKLAVVPSLLFGISLGAYASDHHHHHHHHRHHHHRAHHRTYRNAHHRAHHRTHHATIASSGRKNQFLFVSKKLNEFKLPKALAAIPLIESGYNAKAVSPKGAGGLWQLMPATARQFGISSKDRFQLEPSTVAALNYFSQLHKKFGNWEFAIAAYNAGDGRVQRAIRHNPSATSVSQLNLPHETKEYVKKFYRMQGRLNSYAA
jgi:membrane-bound lytic murein transglycosylase MltF